MDTPLDEPQTIEAEFRRSGRPSVLFVGRSPTFDARTWRKWEAVSTLLDVRIIAEKERSSSTYDGDRVVPLVSCRPSFLCKHVFYVRLLGTIWRQLKDVPPDAVISQSPYDALVVFLGRWLAKAQGIPIIVEVHGDWRSATRYYGSRARRLVAPIADLAAVWGLRQADAIRTIGPAMSKLVEETSGRAVTKVFPTFYDSETYFDTPPVAFPATPTALWVGSLQRTKNPRLLAAAWRVVAARLPEARLVIVGSGPLQPEIERLEREYPTRVDTHPQLASEEVKRTLDLATMLVLPSRSEGLGRVIIESFARGRPVVGTRVGGIPDLVKHELNGLLVPSDDVTELAAAMIRLLSDPSLAVRLGQQAYSDAEAHRWPPDRYARAVFELVEDALAIRAARRATP